MHQPAVEEELEKACQERGIQIHRSVEVKRCRGHWSTCENQYHKPWQQKFYTDASEHSHGILCRRL
jgi:hypothetical protein